MLLINLIDTLQCMWQKYNTGVAEFDMPFTIWSDKQDFKNLRVRLRFYLKNGEIFFIQSVPDPKGD